MIYADVTLEQLNISSHPLPLEMDGGSILIWSPPSHNWAVSCSVDAAQGWAGLRLLPGVAQQLAACPCTGDVSVRGDTWVSWGHCIMSKQCHNTSHCYDGKCGHVTRDTLNMVTRQDTWVTITKPHLTSTPLMRWRMTHPPIACRLRLSTRV